MKIKLFAWLKQKTSKEELLTKKEVATIPMTVLREEEHRNGNIIIRFSLQEEVYRLEIDQTENGLLQPRYIFHQDCYFCWNPYDTWICDTLQPHLRIVFKRLIHSNELRLHWLYRNYNLEGLS